MATYLPRHVDGALAAALEAAPVVILDGPRGAGKTTTAERLAATTLMLPRDLAALRVDPEGYLRSARPPVLLDEWQLAGTDLLWAVKRLVDADPTPGRFLLTGSVEPASYGPTHPLTGRAVRMALRPMTRAELIGRGHEPILLQTILAGSTPPIGAALARPVEVDDLFRAGFPAARAMTDPTLFLDAYAALVSHRGGHEGRDATRVLRTLRVLAALTGQAVPDQRVWESADINKATLREYDDLLARVHLSAPLPAYEGNRLKRLTSYPKRFLADTALGLTLAGITREQLRSDPSLAGRHLESFLLQQLRPQVDLCGGTLTHLRTAGGEREIDAVIEVGSSLIAVEVTASRQVATSDARHMEWFRDQVGRRFFLGLVIHTGTDCYPLADRVVAMPLGLMMGDPPPPPHAPST